MTLLNILSNYWFFGLALFYFQCEWYRLYPSCILLVLTSVLHPAAQQTAPVLTFDAIKRMGLCVVRTQANALPRQQSLSVRLRHPDTHLQYQRSNLAAENHFDYTAWLKGHLTDNILQKGLTCDIIVCIRYHAKAFRVRFRQCGHAEGRHFGTFQMVNQRK
jgi:hypothetical protein